MRRISRKLAKAGGDQPAAPVGIPNRIFLYLQPKTIYYPIEGEENVTVEIELEHPTNTITMLNDHYTPKNIIYLDEFQSEKPTFSVTIKQDDIEDMSSISDTPLMLTLYENLAQSLVKASASSDDVDLRPSKGDDSIGKEELMIVERRPVAQGYIDLLEFFAKTRSRSTCTTFLYPLPLSAQHLTCKIEWEIYSLHPLIKELILSSVVFITFGSLYNMEEQLIDDCEDLMVQMSFISTMPNENNRPDKVLLCSYKGFSKQLIKDQVLDHKWESLKNVELGNQQSMGIMTDSKVNIHKLFQDILATENTEFNFEDIDINLETSLTCNSLHRYILTNHMERILEQVVASNQQKIIVEVMRERLPESVLLQGFVDLHVFMYPGVTNCNFAIEMRPPGYRKPTLPTPRGSPTRPNKKTKRKGSATTADTSRATIATLDIPKEKIPFAIVKICLSKPISDPVHDMIQMPKSEIKYQQFNKCPRSKRQQLAGSINYKVLCEESYREFDEAMLTIMDYMIMKNIKALEDNRQFYCSQLGNMTNKIMRLVACDFNERIATKTNIEFTNLMTIVYQELMARVYDILMKCSLKDIHNCINNSNVDLIKMTDRINVVKYMSEVGNVELAKFFMDKLCEEYANNSTFNFFVFLFNVERETFDEANEYLRKPLKERCVEGEMFIDIISIYIDYKLQLNDSTKQPQENLINSLMQYSTKNSQNISTWILLYCLYKQNKYLPGMEYCRWKYENLYRSSAFMDLTWIPKSRWDIYMPHKVDYKSPKSQQFYKVVNFFLHLGLYQFADWIFDEIAAEAMEMEKYCMWNTFKIFLNKLEMKFTSKVFPVEKYLNPLYLRATLCQINGNLEYFRNSLSDAAMKQYAIICDVKDLDNYADFHLGLLRYAYRMMEVHEYKRAKEAFALCCCNQAIGMVASIGKGKACYRLNDLDEAELAFAQSTRYGIYMPNVWAYLALINLKKSCNYKALECWKYARLNPNDDIGSEILQELKTFNYSDVNLYIDIPERKLN